MDQNRAKRLFLKKIQSDSNIDEFELFDIEKKFSVDLEHLEQKYLKLQQLFHPDKFSNSTEKEQKDSTLISSLINEAYKKLSNPNDRINLLLKLNGFKLTLENKSFNDVNVLEEVMEIQNECMNVDDFESKQKILKDLDTKIKNLLSEISESFEKKKFEYVSKLNIKLSYLEKIRKSLKLK